MIFAAIGDVTYNVLLLAHFLFLIVGAGMAFVGPLFVKQARRRGGRNSEDYAIETTNQVVFPALLLTGIAGSGLVGLSDNTYDFSQLWLTVASILWAGSLVASLISFPPRWLNFFNASDANRRLARISLHVMLLLLLIDMTWKDKLF